MTASQLSPHIAAGPRKAKLPDPLGGGVHFSEEVA